MRVNFILSAQIFNSFDEIMKLTWSCPKSSKLFYKSCNLFILIQFWILRCFIFHINLVEMYYVILIIHKPFVFIFDISKVLRMLVLLMSSFFIWIHEFIYGYFIHQMNLNEVSYVILIIHKYSIFKCKIILHYNFV